ncbi:hypothetical protein IB275_30330 [Pseudomonas sp. PDM21]|uniref:DUF7192 family protein n=1 Tax=Pseudomonas sp. PDM21 TaxID=2769257 RepID=UPI001783D703|nr:hypothetical protein [Pseudomonas sp. PDM21]MBD9674913.1 hypothetical protein [Pseudomonas sp. PDM21]
MTGDLFGDVPQPAKPKPAPKPLAWECDQVLSWEEFCSMVERRERLGLRCDAWEDASLNIYARDVENPWPGTHTLGQAIDLMRNGWSEGAEQVQRGLDHLDTLRRHHREEVPTWSMDVAGAFPCVGAYLAGDPEYMHCPSVDHAPAPLVHLVLPGSFSHLCTSEQVLNYGLGLLALVDELEEGGQSVEVLQDDVTQHLWREENKRWKESQRDPEDPPRWLYHLNRERLFRTRVVLKALGENLDLDRMAFALAHPAMLRRCRFAVVEQVEKMRGVGVNYGNATVTPTELREPGKVYLPHLLPDRIEWNDSETALISLRKAFQDQAATLA